MAAERFAERIGQLHARYIGVAVQVALGTSTLITPATSGTTYAYFENQLHLPASIIGVLFILTGVVAGLTENKWVYWIAGVGFFLLFAGVAFIGALAHLVSFQAGIIYLGLAAYGFLAFPRGEEQDGR